MIVKNSTGYNM